MFLVSHVVNNAAIAICKTQRPETEEVKQRGSEVCSVPIIKLLMDVEAAMSTSSVRGTTVAHVVKVAIFVRLPEVP